jgi:hypothetical protein
VLKVNDVVTFQRHTYTVVRLTPNVIVIRRPVVYGGIPDMYDEEVEIPENDERRAQVKSKVK